MTLQPVCLIASAKAKDWRLVPGHLHVSLRLWVNHSVRPGYFLSAVLKNDLKGAVLAADPENTSGIVGLVHFLWQHCPAECWGSVAKFDAWLARAGAAETAVLT